MAESKFEKDMELLQDKWKSFISLLRTDVKELGTERLKIESNIQKIERLKRILEQATTNPSILLTHKEYLLSFDSSLEKKFMILEAFKARENLENAVAERTARDIVTNDEIRKALRSLNVQKEVGFSLDEQLKSLRGLVNGMSYDRDTIIKYAKKHDIDDKDEMLLLWYPVYKSAKKTTSKKVENNKEKETSKEEFSNKELFIEQLTRYQKLIESNKELLDKYSAIFDKMSPATKEIYKSYNAISSYEPDPNKGLYASGIHKSNYEETMAKLIALNAFREKSSIEKAIKEVEENNYEDIDKIDSVTSHIGKIEFLLDELKNIDTKIGEFNQRKDEVLVEQRVYFYTDSNGDPFIDPEIIDKGHQKSLQGIITKANNGTISKKNVSVLKLNKKNSKSFGREVYAVKNYNVIASFTKMDGDDNGIMILAVSSIDPNTILEDTNKLIRENKDQIEWQMTKIIQDDPIEISIQSKILDELAPMQDTEILGEESDFDGIKTR